MAMIPVNKKSKSEGLRLSHAHWPLLRQLIQAKGRNWLESLIAKEHKRVFKADK